MQGVVEGRGDDIVLAKKFVQVFPIICYRQI